VSIKENLERVLERIEKACIRAGRKVEEVKLLGATKSRTVEEIKEAYDCGLKLFGENRVQEAKEKIPKLKELGVKACWHMIGHLQTNKVKHAVELFDVIESVDRERLVKELEKRLLKIGKKMDVLIEVKLSPEETKHGCSPQELEKLASLIISSPCLNLKGLMVVPPYFENPEEVRPYFANLRKLRDSLEKTFGLKFPELSMGMSHDFEVAIEEGATIVRIGTAIFGERS
jgi:pyridoxal phosphate enzyme (YggS family)